MSATPADTRGKYVSSVTVTGGVITIQYGGTEVNSTILNQTLGLTPYVTADNSVAWKCGAAIVPGGLTTVMPGATVNNGTLGDTATLNKYLPAACRP
jgi:Tfp pilus assembly major pilin PilA